MRKPETAKSIAAICLALLVCGLSTTADAHTRHHHRRRVFRSVMAPIVVAHEALYAVATAPIRIAYETMPTREAIYEGEPIETAYYTNRIARPRAPRAERDDSNNLDESDSPHVAHAEEADLSDEVPTTSRNAAVLRNGVAHAPANAPESVKNAIAACNTLRRKPYIWGGGHGSFDDRGYDCSGTVSYALHHAGVLNAPLPSSDLMRYGESGRGRWITIYTRPGHTFAVIAGLRLDTTDFYAGGNVGPRWHEDMRSTFGYVARHPVGL